MSTSVGDISVSIGLSEEDLLRGAQRIAGTLNDLAKKFEALGAVVDKAMGQTETSTAGAARATEKLGEEHKKAGSSAAEHTKNLADLKDVMGKVTVAAGAVTAAIALIAKESQSAHKEQDAAFRGLRSVAEKTIGAFSGATDAVKELTNDGLLSLAEASKAVQAGLATGFGLEETLDIINAFKDSAAFNRQAGLEFGESVVRAMEGVRMGNSILSDSAGITKNLSMILKEAGKSEQDLQRINSDSSVRRALYNGILKEGALFAGNAAKAADTLAGAQSRQATTTKQAAAEMGEALAPALQLFAEVATSVIGRIGEWIKQNPELSRTILLVAAGVTTAVTAVGSLTVAVLALKTAINPISGLTATAIVGLTGLAGALVAGTVATAANARAQEASRRSTVDLMRQYEALRKIIDDTTTSTDEKERASAKLKDTLSQLFELQPQMQGWFNKEGELLDEAAGKWDRYRTAVTNATKVDLTNAIREGELKLKNLERDLNDASGAVAGVQAKYAADINAAEMMKLAMKDPAKIAQVDANIAAARQNMEDEIFLVAGRIEAQIAKARADLERDRAHLESLDRPMTPQEALGPKPKPDDGNGGGGGGDPWKETAKAFSGALRVLGLQEQLAKANDEPLTPEQVSESLKAIREQFKAYLAAHPEEALALDVEIAQTDQKGREDLKRLAKEADQALRDRLAAQREFRQQDESLLGDHYLQYGKRNDLQEALGTAQLLARSSDPKAAAEGLNQVIELSVALRDLDAVLQKASFESRFEAISRAREQALAGMAGTLHQIQKDLIDAQGNPERERALQEQRMALQTQVLEAQRTGLERLLQDETLTADQREQVERELTSVKEDLYDLDLQAHRMAAEAKLAAERQLAQEKEALHRQEQAWLRDLADADLRQMRERNQEEVAGRQRAIRGLQDQLSALERIWAAEDRRKRQDDLRAEIANIKGQLTHTKIDANGNLVRTYDEEAVRELEKRLGEEQTQDAREQQRQQLQDQIRAAQDSLSALQDSHRTQETARQTFWQNLQQLDLAGYADLTTAAETGLGAWVTALSGKFSEAVTAAQTKAAEIAAAVNSVNAALSGLSGFTAPTLPASLSQSISNQSANVEKVEINNHFPNATNPQAVAQAVESSAKSGLQSGLLATGNLYRRTVPV